MNLFWYFAAGVGVTVMGIAALVGVAYGVLLAWHFRPARLHCLRQTPSFLKAPHGLYSIDLSLGLGSRRKFRWFFGLMVFGQRPEPQIERADIKR